MCSHLDRHVSHPCMHFSVSAWMWLATERTRAAKAWLYFSHLLSLAQHGARERVCTSYQLVISDVAGIKQGEPMHCELRDSHTVRAGRDALWSQSSKQEGNGFVRRIMPPLRSRSPWEPSLCKQTCAYVPSISVLGLGVDPGSGSCGSAPPPAPVPLSSRGSCWHGPGCAVGLAVTGHEQRPGWAWWPPHCTLGCFHFHLLLGGGWALIPTVGLHWYRTSRRCARSPQTPHPPPPPTRPLASTQLVIHLSRVPPAAGSSRPRSSPTSERVSLLPAPSSGCH